MGYYCKYCFRKGKNHKKWCPRNKQNKKAEEILMDLIFNRKK